MEQSKVIRISQEVYAELQRLATPFEDNPDSVLRRLLGLAPKVPEIARSIKNEMDDRIARFLDFIGSSSHGRPPIRPTRSNYFAIVAEQGTTFGYLYPQKRRLKIEIRRDWAEKIASNNWDHELPNGWFNTGISSVYWYIPNQDEEAYQRVAKIVARLRKLVA